MIKYLLTTIMHALIVLLLVVGSFWNATINEAGQGENITNISTVLYLALVFTVLAQISIEISSFTVICCICQVITVVAMFIQLLILNYSVDHPTGEMLGILPEVFSNGIGVLNIFFAPAACMVFSYIVKSLSTMYQPTLTDLLKLGVQTPSDVPSCEKSRITEFALAPHKMLDTRIAMT